MGEWALLPNPIDNAPYRCEGATMQNANQKVINFLNYMDQNQMSWTAWQFDVNHLILNRTTFMFQNWMLPILPKRKRFKP